MFKNIQKYLKSHHVIALFGLLILIIALGQFSDRKTNEVSNFATGRVFAPPRKQQQQTISPLDDNAVQMAPAPDVPQAQQAQTPSCSQSLEAADLLPQGGGAMMSGQNFLTAGYHVGINTVGQSMRNANLQIRSEPPNPQSKVSPWLNTTIEPDLQRRSLEIGCES